MNDYLEIFFDIDSIKFVDDAYKLIIDPNSNSVLNIIDRIVRKHFSERLDSLVKLNKIKRYKINNHHYTYNPSLAPYSLRDLIQKEQLKISRLTVSVITGKNQYKNVYINEPIHIIFNIFPRIKKRQLKTIDKYIINFDLLSIFSKALIPLNKKFPNNCQCNDEYLFPYIEHVWDKALRFICRICGKAYFCSCFYDAFKKYYQIALEKSSQYSERGWPNKFIKLYHECEFREKICHPCRNKKSEIYFCSPMYGSKIMINYGPYIHKFALERNLNIYDAENIVRDILNVPRIGEGWISEMDLFRIIKELFPNEKVIHHAKPPWIGNQHLDIFIPGKKLALEYQGQQHFKPIDFFGGESSFQKTQDLDKRKLSLCKKHGVKLIYFKYNEIITKSMVMQRISDFI